MPGQNAVVIPFGVPASGRGLGLGLAALVHTFAHLDGGGVAIAHLHGRRNDEPATAPPSLVEAFVPPASWREMGGEARGGVGVVLTGSLDPPAEGDGKIQLLAFDPSDGRTRASVDEPIEEAHAGASVVGALEKLCSGLGGQIGALGALRDLAWEPLESVLRAERCALHDPLRGGPHDRLAALLHLGRAIGDAPGSRYPVERLAALALETATHPALDPRLAAAAARALSRAADDAPMHVELVEALAALQLRFGHPDEAERRLNAAIALGPNRAQLYALLSQALRAQGRLESALAALEPPGVDAARGDPMLWTERGMVLAARGDLVGAAAAWKQVLARDPVHPAAFASLATLALRMGDATGAHALTDAALVASAAHPDVLRRAVQLALATESEGIARASRVAQLCTRLLEVSPGDAWAALTLARALLSLGDVAGARLRLAEVDRIGPGSAAAADAQVVRLAIDDPATEEELRSALRAAHRAEPHALGDVAARARRLATLHSAWPGWLAAAVAERRKHRWAAARSALELALELAPGSAAAHVELAEVLLALADSRGAMTHARRALSLEGESPRALLALSRALSASGEAEEARRVARRALAIKPQDEEARALAVALPVARRERGWRDRLRSLWRATTRSG